MPFCGRSCLWALFRILVISDAEILQRKQREADQRQEQNLRHVAKGKKRPEVEMQGQTACIDEHGLSAGLEMDARRH